MGYDLTASETEKIKRRNLELHRRRIKQLKRLVASHQYQVDPEEIADGMLLDEKFNRSSR